MSGGYLTSGQDTNKPPRNARLTGGSRAYEREKDDFYPTPPEILEPLLRVESLPRTVWEPACGDGAITRVLTAHGHEVTSTDLVDRGFGEGRRDFLLEREPLGGALVTNPPFRLWYEFADHATRGLKHRPFKVVLLGRLQLLEGKRVSRLFRDTGLSRVWVSAGRVNMRPSGAEDRGHKSMIAFAWYVWERGWAEEPTIGWFTPGSRGEGARSAHSPTGARP